MDRSLEDARGEILVLYQDGLRRPRRSSRRAASECPPPRSAAPTGPLARRRPPQTAAARRTAMRRSPAIGRSATSERGPKSCWRKDSRKTSSTSGWTSGAKSCGSADGSGQVIGRPPDVSHHRGHVGGEPVAIRGAQPAHLARASSRLGGRHRRIAFPRLRAARQDSSSFCLQSAPRSRAGSPVSTASRAERSGSPSTSGKVASRSRPARGAAGARR